MATKLWLVLAVNPLTEGLAKIGKVWSDGMANNAAKIDDRRKTSIPDEMTFQSKIAEPSEQEYRRVLDPAFVSRSGKHKDDINFTQAYKAKNAWKKYRRNWNHQFETVDGVVAKRFIDQVKAAEDTFAENASKISLALTGLKTLESGPVRIALYWLSGDSKAKGLLRPADRIMEPSEPFSITTVERRNSLRAILSSRLMQSGSAIMHSQFNAAVITSMNDQDNHIAQSLVDPGIGLVPFANGAESHLDYVVENGQLFLSVKVSQI